MIGKSQIYIDVHSYRTAVALVQDDELTEFYTEKHASSMTVGNIYRGRVKNVLSGMDAAFVDIGLDKNAYLYTGETDHSNLSEDIRRIRSNLKEGDEIMVQVVKEQGGSKGARVTQDVSVAGRFLLYTPYSNYIGVSRKIEEESLREKLKEQVSAFQPKGGGFVVRTAAADATAKEMRQDAKFLINTFREIVSRYDEVQAPCCVFEDGDPIRRTIRDVYNAGVDRIILNDRTAGDYAETLLEKIAPKNKTQIEIYAGADILHKFGIAEKVDALLLRRAPLKNGAYLVIDKTEALTVIDVNTGKYVGGGGNLEETVFVTNMLAAKELARQIRLRNIGGIIIADFIDMISEQHREKVLDCLRQELKKDRIKTALVDMTGLGLVEITRKKTRNDAATSFMRACPECEGGGWVYSDEYLTMRLRSKILEAIEKGGRALAVYVSPELFESIFKGHILSREAETVWADRRIYLIPDGGRRSCDFSVDILPDGVITIPDHAKLLY